MVSRSPCVAFVAGVPLRLDADSDGRTPDADDRGRRFEADGVGSELRHAARHVRRHTANELQNHPETALAGRVHVALEAYLAAWTEGEPGVVLQRDADGSIDTGAECVARED